MKILHSKRRDRRAGFSLAELMVVIVILGLLATLVVPNVLDRLKTASVGAAKANIVAIANAIDTYTIENAGRHPESLEELVTPDENGRTYLNMDVVPLDPWKNEYVYEPPGGGNAKFRLYSLGSDGEVGGEADARDITYQAIRNQEI